MPCVWETVSPKQLTADQDLKLIGQTSRGCFLQTANASAWTIFLSEETPRGPLTINLPPNTISFIKKAATGVVPLRQGTLQFSQTVQLSLKDASHWQADPPIKPFLPPVTRRSTITETIQIILQRKAANSLTGILPDLLPLLNLPFPIPATEGTFTKNLHALIICLQSSDTAFCSTDLPTSSDRAMA